MFDRIYKNHLFILLENSVNKLDETKIEKIFKIIQFLVAGQNENDMAKDGGFNSTINVQED